MNVSYYYLDWDAYKGMFVRSVRRWVENISPAFAIYVPDIMLNRGTTYEYIPPVE